MIVNMIIWINKRPTKLVKKMIDIINFIVFLFLLDNYFKYKK